MPAPSQATYSVTALVAAHTTFRDLLDAGDGAAKLKLFSASDALLATFTLDDPCGSVNGTTGQLAFSFPAASTADADGTAAYGSFCDSNDLVHLSLPAIESGIPVTGKLALTTVQTITGLEVTIIGATIG